MSNLDVLDELIDRLEAAQTVSSTETEKNLGGDAIDRALRAAPRATATRSLRADPSIEQFRNELADGLIRADTAGRALDVLARVVALVAAGRNVR